MLYWLLLLLLNELTEIFSLQTACKRSISSSLTHPVVGVKSCGAPLPYTGDL